MKIKTSKLLVVLCLVATMVLALVPMMTLTTAAAETEIVFNLGANGTASHYDGSSKTSYSETVEGYTLSLTGGTQMYTGARDAKGNSCIKLGSSKNTGKFSFTVPNDVTSVVIEVAKYKSNTTKVTANGATTTLTKNSNDGAYDVITIDTTSTKTVSFGTASGGVRAMVNTITFKIPSGCEHVNVTTTTTPASCTEAGGTTVVCDDCGTTISSTVEEALGHETVGDGVVTPPTCTEVGYTTYTCERCGEYTADEVRATGHSYENGKCTECGEVQPLEATLTFDNTSKRTEFTANSKQVWEENGIVFTNNKGTYNNALGDYSNPIRLYKGTTVSITGFAPIIKVEFTCDTADYATSLKTSIGATATVSGTVVTATLAEAADSFNFTVSDAQTRVNSLKVYFEAPAAAPEISQVAINAGTDLSVLVNTTVGENAADYKVNFTLGEDTYTATSEDGIFVLNGVAPQMMSTVIKVDLVNADDEVVSTKEFTINGYLEGIVADEEDKYSAELEALASALLDYGQAADEYKNGLTATEVTGTAPEATDLTVNADDTIDTAASFTTVGVRFDYVNKIYVALVNPDGDNVAVKINGVDATVVDGIVYTDAISATDFDKVYTIELYVDGALYQTVTYSVNSYAYAKWNSSNANTCALARALYLYGVAAEAYVATIIA